ncbi:dTDP-4-dehydrorhamnose 3,5-epimerase, partial [Pseudoalteromonas ruthenica]
MKVIDTRIPDVKIIEPSVFGDERGFFMETWNQKQFEELVTGKPTPFVQDNHSKSKKGILRGLHYQT